jgi:DNA-nicking Smr family endonuclease
MPAKLDHRELKRLRRGRDRIDATLDLHGFKQEPAQRALTAFLLQAHQRQYKWVLVITGKGVRGEGVLRRAVPGWLKMPPLGDIVLGFDTAQPDQGGTGALCVRLRKKRD